MQISTSDGYSNQFYWAEGFDKVQSIKQPAADFIIEKLKEYPNEIILITVGPVTNLGDIIDKDPNVLKLANHIYSMFGSFYIGYGQGKGSPVLERETNTRGNVAASKKLSSSGAKITYAGYDVTTYSKVNYELIELLNIRNSPLTDAVVGLYSLWTWGKNSPKTESVIHDAVAVSMLLWPDLFTTRKAHVKVTDEGFTVIDESKEPNCEIGMSIKYEKFLDRVIDRLMKQNLMR